MKLNRTDWPRCIISNERDLGPRIKQNPKFAPRSETDEDPRCFHMGVLPPRHRGYLFTSKYLQRDFC